MKKYYHKLVRDKIPNIIQAEGKKVKIRKLNQEEYQQELNKKLQEEVQEYLEDYNVQELADVVEVIDAILDSRDVSRQEFEKIRKAKAEKRGIFQEKIFLEEVEE